jgi:hypothetical protein
MSLHGPPSAQTSRSFAIPAPFSLSAGVFGLYRFAVAAILTGFLGSITISDAAEFLGLAKRVIERWEFELAAFFSPIDYL